MKDSKTFDRTQEMLADLTSVLCDSKRLMIMTHNNPDPDSMATAAALKYLACKISNTQASVVYGGVIGRAENQAMIHLLNLKLIHVSQVNWKDYDMLALVDHQPRSRISPWPLSPEIILDHHPRVRLTPKPRLVDVRKGFGSNSTLLFQYLKAADLKIPRFLATALIYGILSDTQDFSRGTFPSDLDAYLELFPLCDHVKLHNIRDPVLSLEYMRDYWTGIQRAEIWTDTVITFAGPILVPDLVAEIADRMLHIENMKYSIASGFHNNVVYYSIRSKHSRKDVGKLIRSAIGKRGTAGGHGFMAGAQIRIKDDIDPEEIVRTVNANLIKKLYPNDFDKRKSRPFQEADLDHLP